jgi:branched-chain amino acid aminotransferase
MITKYSISINKKIIPKSRINEVNFQDLGFGKYFADHMYVAKYKNGEWISAEIMPFGEISVNPAMSALHYGQTIFEGMKAYRNIHGNIQLFRPLNNWKRMNVSAERLAMPPVPEEIFMGGLIELLKIDEQWVPSGKGESLYIRPFYIASDTFVGMRPSSEYLFIIFNCPVSAYYANPVKVKLEKNFIRATPGGVGYVKMGGNYARSMLATELAKSEGYDNVIWVDSHEYKYVEECGTMNIFFVIDNILITPPTSGTILEGITRDSVIKLAEDLGYQVQVRKLSKEEILESYQQGRLQECFGTGTAASISPIVTIGYDQNIKIQLEEPSKWNIVPKLQRELDGIRISTIKDRFNWIFPIS